MLDSFLNCVCPESSKFSVLRYLPICVNEVRGVYTVMLILLLFRFSEGELSDSVSYVF